MMIFDKLPKSITVIRLQDLELNDRIEEDDKEFIVKLFDILARGLDVENQTNVKNYQDIEKIMDNLFTNNFDTIDDSKIHITIDGKEILATINPGDFQYVIIPTALGGIRKIEILNNLVKYHSSDFDDIYYERIEDISDLTTLMKDLFYLEDEDESKDEDEEEQDDFLDDEDSIREYEENHMIPFNHNPFFEIMTDN